MGSSDPLFDSKPIIASTDLFIAEVSYPSTGMGIEMGWAVAHHVPILALYKVDTKPSASIKIVTNNLVPYVTPDDLIQKITNYIFEKNRTL